MKLSLLYISLFTILISSHLTAQHWTGQVNSDWNNSSNWSEWPIGGDDITIDAGLLTGNKAMPIVSSNSVFTPAEVIIENGGVLTINAVLSTEDDVTISGLTSGININAGGTLNVSVNDEGRLNVAGGFMTINSGELNVGQRIEVGEGSMINLLDGSINVIQRLIIGGGGIFIQQQGTVTIGETFGIGDGSGDINSLYELRGGILNVTGEMSFENEAGKFNPTFFQSGGSLQMNGELVWFGENPGSGSPKFIQTGGTSTITGNIENLSGSTVNMYISLSGSAHMNHSGNRLGLTQLQDSFIMEALATVDFTDVTIENDGVFIAHDSQVGFTGSNKIDGDGKYQFADVILHAGELNHDDPKVIFIGGNFIMNGLFKPSSNMVLFNGDEEQLISNMISNNNPIEFYDFTVNNTSSTGVTLHLPINIDHHLQLNNGKINSASSMLVNIGDDASCNEGSDSSFVNGPMSKSDLSTFLFPVGKNENFARIILNSSDSNSDPVIVEYFDEAFNLQSEITSPLTQINQKEYWRVSANPDKEISGVTLYWEDAAQSGISDCEVLTVAYSAGISSPWFSAVSETTGNCSDTGSGNIRSTEPLEEAMFFTFGFLSDMSSNYSVKDDKILIYPNPVNEEFEIKLNSDVQIKSLGMVDFLGNNIPLIAVQNNISLRNSKSGIYFLKIELSNGSVLTKKIIKI